MHKIKGNPFQGLLGATLGFFVGFAAVALFGPTAKLLDEYMMMTATQLGFLVSMPQLSGSLLRIPFGAWVDTTGGKKPFLILLIFSALGMAGLCIIFYSIGLENLTISHYPLLLFLALLCGCGVATFSVGIGQVSYWYPQSKQGQALGAYAGLGNMAPGLFSYLVPLLIGTLMITGAYLSWLGVVIAGIIVYTLMTPNAFFFQFWKEGKGLSREEAKKRALENGQELFPSGSVKETLWAAAKIWKTWPLVILYFTTFGGFLALITWFPTYWQEYFNKDLKTAGALTMLFAVLASVIRVLGGIISDKFGGIKTIFVSILILLFGSLILTFSTGIFPAIIGLICLSIGMGITNAGVFKLVPSYIAKAIGGGAGWVGGLGAFGGFAIPPILGYFVDSQGMAGYANGFSTFILLSIISLGCIGLLKRGAN